MASPEDLHGESGVRHALDEVVFHLHGTGIVEVDDIPLGGTIAMVWNPDSGTYRTQSQGAFGTGEIQEFNSTRREYSGGSFIEPTLQTQQSSFSNISFFDFVQTSEGRLFLQNGSWSAPSSHTFLEPGNYRTAQLATPGDIAASSTYAYHLSLDLTSENFPLGVRLDSNDVWARGVFPAVVCSYMIPAIDRKIKQWAQQFNKSEQAIKREAVFIVPVGTDRQVEVNSFLDAVSFFTGLTFITVGANSSFGTPHGDAEVNIRSVERVTRALHEGKLRKGKAYAIADGMVLWNLIRKDHPEETGIRPAIKDIDGRYYGGTFQSYFADTLDQLDIRFSYPEYEPLQYDPSLFFRLLPFGHQNLKRDQFRHNAAEKSMNLAYAMGSVFRSDVQNIPLELPLGTRVWIIEGSGESNGPDYAIEQIQQACDRLAIRTGGHIRPLLVVTSSTGFPFVGKKYSAGLHKGLLESNEKVVSGRTITPITLEILSALLLLPKMSRSVRLFPDNQAKYQLTAQELEDAINKYGLRRELPFF